MSMGNFGEYTVTACNSVGTAARPSASVSMFTMQFTNGTPHLTVGTAKKTMLRNPGRKPWKEGLQRALSAGLRFAQPLPRDLHVEIVYARNPQGGWQITSVDSDRYDQDRCWRERALRAGCPLSFSGEAQAIPQDWHR